MSSIAAERPTTPSARDTARSYLPALDGLRAIAVLLVLGYHAFPNRIPGGFVGVDIFFVLSGFLITALLLREVREHHRVAVRRFWIRRLRRLAPALFVMVVLTASVTLVVGHDTGAGLRSQVAGAFTWTSNWVQIHEGWSYADQNVPPLLNHLWSLGIEEQFYLIWPLIFLALITVLRRRLTRYAVLALAAISAASMAAWFILGDPSRAYLGLDSHSFGLLLGAALALSRAPHLLGDQVATPRQRRRCTAVGLFGLAVIGLFGGFVAWDSRTTFLGGLAVANIAAAALVLAAANQTALARVLSWTPLRWVGERSYGLYLWHWPLIVIATRLAPPDYVELAAGGGIVLGVAAAALSYRFVESPMRRNGVRATLQHWARGIRDPHSRRSIRLRMAAGAGVVSVTTMALALWQAPTESTVESSLRAGQDVVASSAHQPTSSSESEEPNGQGHDGCQSVEESAPVSAFGDSVTVAIAPSLMEHRPGSAVVAKVGWQYHEVAEAIREAARAGRLHPTVLIATGTNGDIDPADLDALVTRELGDRQVGLVAPYVPGHDWSEQSVSAVRSIAAAHDHVHLVDWNGLATRHDELTAADRVHPTDHGSDVFSEVVGQAMAHC